MDLAAEAVARIVVVDDDEDTRLNLRDILELDGYEVSLAGSARELLEGDNWNEVSLVLLDRKLPDGTAQDILPLLRQKAAEVAVIIVTGYADIEGAIDALRSGAADYILKPVSPDALRASVRRVLQRRHSEREIARLNSILTRSESRYRSLFENTLDGLLFLDEHGVIVAANPAACIQVGLAPGALDGSELSSITIATSERSRPAVMSDFLGSARNTGECTLERSDGSTVHVDYRAVANFTPGLNLVSLRDTTARKRAEERARQSERLAAIGETMAGLVHESRNALQRSKASLEMLSLEIEDRPEALKLVARVQKAQEDLHRLFEEVRQWAAPLQLRKEECDLREIWKEVWCQVYQAHSQQTARLEEHLDCEPVCQVDRFAITQVFRNIFENALEASPNPARVFLRCSSSSNGSGQELAVTITDQGPGLTAEQQKRIFEPFFTTKAKGTGLGMAIAQRIVQSHGGTIVVSSPQGAQIQITLPRRLA